MKLRNKAVFTGLTPESISSMERKDAATGWNAAPERAKVFVKIHNVRHSDNQIKSEKSLGAGVYGVVFATEKGVVKFDRSSTEAKLYAMLPSYLRKLSVLPQNLSTGSIRLPESWRSDYLRAERKKKGKPVKAAYVKLSTIHREDLDGIGYGSPCMTRFAKLREILDIQGGQRGSLTPNEIRRNIYNGFKAWHKENVANIGHDSYTGRMTSLNLTEEDKKSLKQFAGGIARLVRFGIIPGDMHDGNVGRRKDGSFVLRDLGFYTILDDRPANVKKLGSRTGPMTKHNVAQVAVKLRTSRSPSNKVNGG